MSNQAIGQIYNTYKVETLHPAQRNIGLVLSGIIMLIALIFCATQLISLFQWATTFSACQAQTNSTAACNIPTGGNSLWLILTLPTLLMLNFSLLRRTEVKTS